MTHDPTYEVIIERNLNYLIQGFENPNTGGAAFLEVERENIFAAIKDAARIPQLNYPAAKFLTTLSRTIEQTDSITQWSQAYVRIINRYTNEDVHPQCYLLNRLAKSNRAQGQFHKSLAIFEKSKAIGKKAGDLYELACAEYGVATNHIRLHNLTIGLKHAQDALALLAKLDVQTSEVSETKGNIYNALGLIYNSRGLTEEALRYFQQALVYFEHASSELDTRIVLLNMALTMAEQGELDRAVAQIREMILKTELSGQWLTACDARANLGAIFFERQMWEEAYESYAQIDTHELRKRGHIRRCANAHSSMGGVLAHLGRYREAKGHLEEAIAIYRETDDQAALANTLTMLGMTFAKSGARMKSQSTLTESSKLLAELGETAFINTLRKELQEAFSLLWGRKRIQPRA